ncbi:hypothetical protein OROMI_012489 [Orobanche minor]
MFPLLEIIEATIKFYLTNEYKHRISGWNFNLDGMKAEASLIQDDDPSEKDEDMQNKQLQYQPSLSKSFKVLQHQLSFASQCSDAADSDDNTLASVSPVGSTTNMHGIKIDNPFIFSEAIHTAAFMFLF